MNAYWGRNDSSVTVNYVITAFVFAAENKVRFVLDTTDVPLLVSFWMHVWMIRVEDFSSHFDFFTSTVFDKLASLL